MTSSQPSVGDRYILPTGQNDAARLDTIHAVYGPVSLKALDAAAIDRATRAADVGCGTGTISRWMASRVGPAGRVDAIDIAPEQIEVAQATPAAEGSGAIHYHVGSAYDSGLAEQSFDLVFSRLVLCHLNEPQRAIAHMARLLRPGGRLVLVDTDLRDIFTMPACPFYQAYVDECVIPYQTTVGVDYSVGRRLQELLLEAGLRTDVVLVDQPVFRDGAEKHLWEKTWTVALQRAVPAGVITMERGMALIEGMERHTARPDVWVAVAKMFAVVGTRTF